VDPQRVRIYHTEALVLHARDLGEADRVLTLASPLGKLRAVAKGVRRVHSRKAGHLDLFMRSELQLARGSQLDIITQAQCIESYDALRGDALRFASACYAAELVDAVLPEEEQPELYQLIVQVLQLIDQADSPELWLRYLDIKLLEGTGFQPELYRCVRCQAEIQPAVNYFGFNLGGLVCADCRSAGALAVSVHTQKLLRYIQRHGAEGVARLVVAPSTLREAEALLVAYWQHVLEREIRSAAAIRQLRQPASNENLSQAG